MAAYKISEETCSVVVQDAETYARMTQLADYAESIENIRQALSEKGRPLKEFTAEFEAKNGIVR